jgi:tetratricopeptide (TPR) repeat protein
MSRNTLLGILLALCGSCELFSAESPPRLGGSVLVEKENIVDARLKGAPWKAAAVGAELEIGDRLRTGEFSRAAVRFTDLSVLRVDELTEIQVLPPVSRDGKRTLDLPRGATYFFSREKGNEIQIRTPAANGALRGTEFAVRVDAGGHTTMMLYEGEVELSNAQGRVVLKSGEQGEADIGKAPRKTAVIDAKNIIQWCLYYPGVIDPAEFPLTAAEKGRLAESLAAYRAGDLLGALTKSQGVRGDGSEGVRLYRAATMLSVGQVEKARAELRGTKAGQPLRLALEQMIAAVQYREWKRKAEPRTASGWMAESYERQSRGNLNTALAAARKAVEISPEFGFAWVRVAELEFSFGRTPAALKALDRGLQLAPRNAKAHALQGFLQSAENKIGAARSSFDEAIAMDGALADAWLGRGLTFIRQGHDKKGRADLQTAAALEPNRSILRSYLGKAFSEVGNAPKADAELKRAIQLDPNDPTPWLYSAIQRKQENRYNQAIDDLEKSVTLNNNRRLYRSEFLLDQDLAIRNANLASIYRNNGMIEQSVREAVRAVNNDYTSAPAHLFLSNSYNDLRDPSRILLRYESAWSSELLVANLLSPVGGGSLSQFVSQQEYSKLFEKDGPHISSLTEWSGDGKFRERASQFGTFGNLSYALDAAYYYDNGVRPNNKVSYTELLATFKLQLGPQDSLFFQIKPYFDFRGGDLVQRYDPHEKLPVSALTYDFHEKQEPGRALIGWHHEWSPGNHTLLLAGRLANSLHVTDKDRPISELQRDIQKLVPPGFDLIASDPTLVRDDAFFRSLAPYRGKGRLRQFNADVFDLDFQTSFEIYSVELQQILTLGPNTAVFGARYQDGRFDTRVRLTDYANGADPFGTPLFADPPTRQDVNVDFDRLTLYFYDTLRLSSWLSLTGGVAYDHMNYPENFQSPPVSDRQASLDRVFPKVGATLQPWKGATVRAAYTEFMGGASFDENIRLEPTQVAGFLQSYRSLASEGVFGPLPGSLYTASGVSFEQILPTRTYLGVEYLLLKQNADHMIGAFDLLGGGGVPFGNMPSSLREKVAYREESLTATVNQLIGDEWSLGARYRYTRSKLRRQRDGFEEALSMGLNDDFVVLYRPESLNDLAAEGDRQAVSTLQELSLFVLYNHPSGFFGRFEANWYGQQNDNFVRTVEFQPAGTRPRVRTRNLGLAGDQFWQFNLQAGYRFHRNQCEISLGLLNLTGTDYHLDPLTPHLEFPRDRTLFIRCKLNF